MENNAIIVIDYQYDFVSKNGSLYVEGAEIIKPYIENLLKKHKSWLKIATRDWHPKNHCSFKKWPEHCVQNTKGAEIMIDKKMFDKIINKGIAGNADSYSGFFDDKGHDNGLNEYLKKHNIKNIVFVGVALDICVSATFKDAIKLGYKASIDLNGTKGIENKI